MKYKLLFLWNLVALWLLLFGIGFLGLCTWIRPGLLVFMLIPVSGAGAMTAALLVFRREPALLSRTLLLAYMGLLCGLGLDLIAVAVALEAGATMHWIWLSLLAVVAGFGAFVVFARSRLRVGALVTAVVLLAAFLLLQTLPRHGRAPMDSPAARPVSAVQAVEA
jgi:hypothetical protein